MRLKDMIHLSLKNVRTQPKRSLLVMAVMGAIFGLVFTLIFWWQGMVNYYAEFAGRETDGKIVFAISNSLAGSAVVRPETDLKMASRAEMIADAEKFGGKMLGDARQVGMYGGVVLSADLVKGAIEIDLSRTPAAAMPVLITKLVADQLVGEDYLKSATSVAQKQATYEKYREQLLGKTFTDARGGKYFVVGLARNGFALHDLSFRGVEKANVSVLNSLLKHMTVYSQPLIVIDNGKSQTWQTGEELSDNYLVSESLDKLIVVFANRKQAYGYFKNGRGGFANVDLPGRNYNVELIAGMSPEMEYLMKAYGVILNIACAALSVVAIIVIVFTSIRLVSQDRQNIALYYSLGATTGQVRKLYWCYFGIIMAGAVVFALLLAGAVDLGFSIANQGLLATAMMLAFGLPDLPRIILLGWNLASFGFVIIMLLMPLLCVWVNGRQMRRAAVTKVA